MAGRKKDKAVRPPAPKSRKFKGSSSNAGTGPPDPAPPSPPAKIDRNFDDPGAGEVSEEELSAEERELLEDMALEYHVRTGSIRLTATLMKRSVSATHRLIKNAREKRKQDLLTIETAQAASDILTRLRFAQVTAMDEFTKAQSGSFQRNAFLTTYLNAVRQEEQSLKDLGIIPTAPKELDLNFRETREMKVTVLHQIGQLPEKQQEEAVKGLYHLLSVVKKQEGG